ncbi:MAG: hypothetical protein SangKO_013390 [Sandaracinaceae bacterium]
MRTVLILVPLCVAVACDDGSTETDPSEPVTIAETAEVEPAADEAPTAPAVATTTGFIEASVGGELKRFEYLEAAHNTAAANGTFLEARPSAESEESFKFALVNLDVREMDFPTSIRSNVRRMQMAGMNYWDAEGEGHPVVFDDDSLTCQSLESLLLRCTFSGTAHPDDGGPVAITDGRLEVQLTTDALRDRFIEGTSGAVRRPGTR